jgi:ElaB/YqjD/DUF883 family membrane-anchored ribosome-binding protein
MCTGEEIHPHRYPIHTMSTDLHPEPTINQLSEAARESARRAADTVRETAKRAAATANDVTGAVEDVAGEITDASCDAARRATDTVKEMYHSATLRAEDTLATSREYVRRNPVPVVLGAIAFGVAIGYTLMMARRKPTFGERYADEPLVAVREAILGALAPVTQRVHKGYDSARDGAEKVMDRMHNFGPGSTVDSFSDRIGRISNNLKFW